MNAIRFFADLRRANPPRDPNIIFAERLTVGERLADRVASVGGSWGFIIGFGLFLAAWAVINMVLLGARAFDPFPFIFLNLMLSMLAALQAPIIMMSQNRQSVHDRLDAHHDYEVNTKAEMEIVALHTKLDELREQQWVELIKLQEQQLALLARLMSER